MHEETADMAKTVKTLTKDRVVRGPVPQLPPGESAKPDGALTPQEGIGTTGGAPQAVATASLS